MSLQGEYNVSFVLIFLKRFYLFERSERAQAGGGAAGQGEAGSLLSVGLDPRT